MNEEIKELTPFALSLKIMDQERRIKELEDDMKEIKPIVYDTSRSVKAIERSVEKMTENSEKIRGYFLNALIVGGLGILFFALQSLLTSGGS